MRGAKKVIDLTGNRIGRLVVSSLSEKRGKAGQYYWVCVCDCGTTKDISQQGLIKGWAKSCGCLLKEHYSKMGDLARERNKTPDGVASFNLLYGSYRDNRKNHEFDLTEDQFKTLTSSNCYYCGVAPLQKRVSSPSTGTYFYNGIDRVDNQKGYTIDNSRPCCGICNKAKRDLGEDVFFEWIYALTQYNKYGYSSKSLYQGFVKVVDVLGQDATVVNAARVSFGKRIDTLREQDISLLKYLAENEHTSPFRHVFVQFHVKAPEFIARQWWKHIVGTEYTFKDTGWNEISGRYVSYEHEIWIPEVLRVSSPDKKQGSEDIPVEDNEYLLDLYKKGSEYMFDCYQYLLSQGVCNEQARTLLPLNFYTEWYWTASLQAIANFCQLRTSPHAQKEIAEYAEAISEMVSDLFPNAWAALMKRPPTEGLDTDLEMC